MATDHSFVEYVTEQSGLTERITFKRMFEESDAALRDIAYLAHVGGFVAGVLFTFLLRGRGPREYR